MEWQNNLLYMSIKPVVINLLLVIFVSILFVALLFIFGYASNPDKCLVQILILYVVLISIHLVLNWYWFRNTLSVKTLIILSLGVSILYIFLYRLLV